MLKKIVFALAVVFCSVTGALAQIITTEPALLQEDSKDVVIYYHADQGNKALFNLPSDTKVYAHTGLITSVSKDDSDWKYVKSKWGVEDPTFECEYVGPNTYKLNIGEIRSFYNVTSLPSSEKIKKIGILFRNANASLVGRTASGGDILIDVAEPGLQVSISTNVTGTLVTPENPVVKFTISSTEPARLSLGINGAEVAFLDNATRFETEYTFTEFGTYNCYGNAKVGDDIKSTLVKLAYGNASKQVDYPGGKPVMGPVLNPDGSTTFCVAAPEKESVMMLASWNNFEQNVDAVMNYQDYNGHRYFWKTVQNLDPDKYYIYYFLIDGSITTGDPYALLVLDPTNDKYISSDVFPDMPEYPSNAPHKGVFMAAYKANINKYDWKVKSYDVGPKDNLTIYELLLRDFTGDEGSARGDGTLRKAMEKIPYLRTLGVNAVELMPVNEFSGNNSWGYNPNFYFAPDKAYGTPDDYKEFIDLCHENGMAVILDMVFNQSDWQHPWYRMYDKNANPMFNATAPHDYSVLNDWNQDHELVRQQWKDVVRFWMTEYKVDGFRFDLVKGLGNNDSYGSGTEAYNSSRVANMREIQLAMNEVNPNAIFINENLAQAKEENEMAAFGQQNWANVNNEGGQFAMGFKSSSNLNRFSSARDGRTAGSTISYLESHDEERLAYKQKTNGASGVKGNHAVSMRRLGSAAAQMLMNPGAHMIWQFQELGNDQTTKNSSGNNTNPKKVCWSYLDDPDRAGLYQNYCELINLRREVPQLFTTGVVSTSTCGSANWANGRSIVSTSGNLELFTFVNPNITGDITMTAAFGKTGQENYHILSHSYGVTPSFDVDAKTVTVPANSYVVIGSKAISSVEGVEMEIVETLSVRGIRGALLVEAAPSQVNVFDINGGLRYIGGVGEIALPAGVYIVKCGSIARKVMVL